MKPLNASTASIEGCLTDRGYKLYPPIKKFIVPPIYSPPVSKWVNEFKDMNGNLTEGVQENFYRGCTTHTEGNLYLGQWKNDAYEGRGTIIYSLGDISIFTRVCGLLFYWRKGTYSGSGRRIFFNGRSYNGGWKNGKNFWKGVWRG